VNALVQHDAQEQALLDAVREVSRESWRLWGSKATGPSPRHAGIVRALERSTDRGRDGFVSFGGAQ